MSHLEPCPDKPLQGAFGATVQSPDAILLDLIGLITTIAGAVEFLFVEPGAAGAFVNLAGFVVPLFAGVMYIQKCLQRPSGIDLCVAGIVDSLEGPRTSNLGPGLIDELAGEAVAWAETTENPDWFPFLQEHPCFTLVVKCRYWDDVGPAGGADFVWYNRPDGDPIVTCYYEDSSLCPKLFWTTAGATVGAAVGSYGGYLAAGWLLGLCAATVICGILALLVAVFIGIFGAIVGGMVGNELGSLPAGTIVGGDPAPEVDPDEPGVRGAAMFRVGDYVAVKGNAILAGWLGNARAYWFIREAFWYGHNVDDAAPYSHTVADEFLVTVEEDGAHGPMEAPFCGFGLSGVPDDTGDGAGEICADFAYVGDARTLPSPQVLGTGWSVSNEAGNDLRFETYGQPAGVRKLFVPGDDIRFTFDRPVVVVRAQVGWLGGVPVRMEAFAAGASVGLGQAPAVADIVHTLIVTGPEIDAVVFTAQEGLVVRVCVEYA